MAAGLYLISCYKLKGYRILNHPLGIFIVILKSAYVYRAYGYCKSSPTRCAAARTPRTRTPTRPRSPPSFLLSPFTPLFFHADSLMNLSSAMKRQTVLIAASGIARSDDPAISFARSLGSSRYLRFDSGPMTISAPSPLRRYLEQRSVPANVKVQMSPSPGIY